MHLNVATDMSTLSAIETRVISKAMDTYGRRLGDADDKGAAWSGSLIGLDDVLLTYSLTHYTDNIRNISWHTSYSQMFVSTSVDCTRVDGRMPRDLSGRPAHMLVCVIAHWDCIDWPHEWLTKTEFALVYCFPTMTTIMGRRNCFPHARTHTYWIEWIA